MQCHTCITVYCFALFICLSSVVIIMNVFAVVPTVTSLSITRGPQTGFTVVTVIGTSFVTSSLTTCRFGTLVVAGAFLTATSITCTSPVSAAAGSVALEVSLNNQDYTADAVAFLFDRASSLSVHLSVCMTVCLLLTFLF